MRSQKNWKIEKFSKTWFFDFQRNFNNFRKIMFSKILDIFKKFRNFQKISKIFGTRLWRILIFDLVNENLFFLWIEVDFRAEDLKKDRIWWESKGEKLLYRFVYFVTPNSRFYIKYCRIPWNNTKQTSWITKWNWSC